MPQAAMIRRGRRCRRLHRPLGLLSVSTTMSIRVSCRGIDPSTRISPMGCAVCICSSLRVRIHLVMSMRDCLRYPKIFYHLLKLTQQYCPS